MVNQDFNSNIDAILQQLKNQGFADNVEKGQVINLISLKCPEPLMMLRQALRTAAVGANFIVIATDPSTERDFAGYCRFSGHQLHFSEKFETGLAEHPVLYVFILEKAQLQK